MSNNTNSTLEPSSTSSVLTSLPLLDEYWFDNSTHWARYGTSNLDVLQIDDHNNGNDDDDDKNNNINTEPIIAICHLDFLSDFTLRTDKASVQSKYEEAAAVALAAHQLNVGDGSLVPRVANLNNSCPIRFSVGFSDTEINGAVTLNHVAEVTSEQRSTLDTRMTQQQRPEQRPRPCAFIGAAHSIVSLSSSLLTGLRGYPQVSPSSTSANLDDKQQYPLFARSIPSDHANAIPIVQYFGEVLGVRHLAIININDSYGSSFVQGMLLAARSHGMDMAFHHVAIEGDIVSIREAIHSIKEIQYNYIWCIVYAIEMHDQIIEEATKEGIAGTGIHNWFFSDSYIGLVPSRLYEAGSVWDKGYNGVGMIEASAGIPGLLLYDKFRSKLAEINNPIDLAYLESLYPKPDDNDRLYDTEGFQDFEQSLEAGNAIWAIFAYEAAIALGLAACDVLADQATLVEGHDRFLLNGTEHYQRMVNSTFEAVSGKMIFDPWTGSRQPQTVLYKVTNFRSTQATTTNDGMVYFREVVTNIYQNGKWQEVEQFLFNDGTSNVQPDLPLAHTTDQVVSLGVRTTVLVLCGLLFCQVLGFMYWTERHKKSRVVLASQPFFVHTICLGILVFGSAIIPLSFDHGILSLQGCTIACNVKIWLEVIGFGTTVSAFLAKTHRVNRILNNPYKFKRIKVTVQQVATPIIITLSGKVHIILSFSFALCIDSLILSVGGTFNS